MIHPITTDRQEPPEKLLWFVDGDLAPSMDSKCVLREAGDAEPFIEELTSSTKFH